jgi:hypothetical protein
LWVCRCGSRRSASVVLLPTAVAAGGLAAAAVCRTLYGMASGVCIPGSATVVAQV